MKNYSFKNFSFFVGFGLLLLSSQGQAQLNMCRGTCLAALQDYIQEQASNPNSYCHDGCTISIVPPAEVNASADTIVYGLFGSIGFFGVCEENLELQGCGGSTLPTSANNPIDSILSPQCAANSTINTDNLALSEVIPLTGVPFKLVYSSDRLRSSSTFNPKSIGLGSWVPEIVHHYDPNTNIGLVYYGNGGIRNIGAVAISTGYYTTDTDGLEVYYFNSSGVHTSTRDALTGVTKYNFIYDSSGRIASIIDRFGNNTQFSYGTGSANITSPYGQVTQLTFDSNGLLATSTNPNSETYSVNYDSSGNLTNFKKPMGQQSTVSYDSVGHVVTDLGAGGDFLSFLYSGQTQDPNSLVGFSVNMSTAMNRNTSFSTTGNYLSSSHSKTASTSATFSATDQLNGAMMRGNSTGELYQENQGQDPRFGWLAPIPETSSYQIMFTNISVNSTVNMTANLSNPSDPFSFSTLTYQKTLQNDPAQTFSTSYNASSRVLTSTSAANRRVTEQLNPLGHPQSLQVGNLLPLNLSYDSRGNLTSAVQGVRKSLLTYDSFGNVATSTDALDRKTSFKYNKSNRLIRETLRTVNAEQVG